MTRLAVERILDLIRQRIAAAKDETFELRFIVRFQKHRPPRLIINEQEEYEL